VLTGTVIPLMLAFEHRNYFPSVGLLLAAASVAVLEGGLRQPRFRFGLVCIAAFFYAFVTWMRAEEWSDPLRLALSEANKRPDSSAAQYELAHMLLNAHRKGEETPMTQQAFEVLERARRIPDSDVVHEELLIVGHAQIHEPIDPDWWRSMIEKLRSRPPTTSDISALMELQHCYADGVCTGPIDGLRLAYEAAASHPSSNGVFLSSYGELAEHFLQEPDLAEKQFRAALAVAPDEPTTHANLITFLIHHGRLDEARVEIEALRRMNHLGALDARVADLESKWREAKSGISPQSHSAPGTPGT
jgi:hypothetical protein